MPAERQAGPSVDRLSAKGSINSLADRIFHLIEEIKQQLNHTDMSDVGKIEEISESLKRYLNTNYELIKLKAVERFTVILADLISDFLVGLVVFLFVFFTSLWAGFYLSVRLGDNFSGFGIVAGFYLLVGLIMIILRKKVVEKPLRNKIIRKIFSNN